eukprot:TRINITY_DN3992_c0_g1_i2.p1 TRINITY_DN3992_c0_g1~~TRINITY_DN3992_c0_g1_i2.p1  ORF type:complete len:276 (+),score=35.86 TRINITY_DN3992_c0_g1_i2:50-829(+)
MVTRFQLHGVPHDVGMSITGHKSLEAYLRYDHSAALQSRAAQICMRNEPHMRRPDGSRKTYHDILQELVSELYNHDDRVSEPTTLGTDTEFDVIAATTGHLASHVASGGAENDCVAEFKYRPKETYKPRLLNSLMTQVHIIAPDIDMVSAKRALEILIGHGLPVTSLQASYLPQDDLELLDDKFHHVTEQAKCSRPVPIAAQSFQKPVLTSNLASTSVQRVVAGVPGEKNLDEDGVAGKVWSDNHAGPQHLYKVLHMDW